VVFSAVMTWARQYLILHTGNRMDAMLGHKVFDIAPNSCSLFP